MAKRSPILGYNHNVRYRGLVFHVQTEDSGLLSPHLFTHLFYEGVIISTRKLVYDAGSAEDSIKGLMQAQHKVVLKDLKRGHFDDKIDVYLVNTPGLLPRGEVEDGAKVEAGKRADTAVEEPRADAPPPPDALDAPTWTDDKAEIAAAIAAANETVRNRNFSVDSSPEIEIRLDLDAPPSDDDKAGRRNVHDTDVQIPIPGDPSRPSYSDGVPGLIGASPSRSHSESAPVVSERRTGDRSAVGAASLPPARPITRPPSRAAVAQPQVMSRPLGPDDVRRRGESDAVEVYAPAPPSVEAPPGVIGERPGQYAQHKRAPSQKVPIVPRERSNSTQIPAGLGRPQRVTGAHPIESPGAAGARSDAERRGGVIVKPASPVAVTPPPTPPPIPRAAATADSQVPAPHTPRPRTPTPARISGSNPVVPSRTSSTSSTSGGVVMTRPAVIVGAPARAPTGPRVRKAREEEGRGFGQGLISEKSLDEVILAYLSEDADDK